MLYLFKESRHGLQIRADLLVFLWSKVLWNKHLKLKHFIKKVSIHIMFLAANWGFYMVMGLIGIIYGTFTSFCGGYLRKAPMFIE